jgi:demethylmenaquinone methyltransferase/2-methoxy-6-polyprenyl-1,4-benzoquinol methylase
VKLPYKNAFFNAIFISFTLELFDTPEIPNALSECWRVLQIVGRICVVSLSRIGRATLLRRLYEWGHRKLPRLLDCRPIFTHKAIEDAGFRIISAIQMSMWGLPVEVVLASKID